MQYFGFFTFASVRPFIGTGRFTGKVENMALVDRVKPLETTEFVEKYVIYFSQPLDHRHPKKVRFINVLLWHTSDSTVLR